VNEPSKPSLEADLDEVFAAEPSTFVAVRDALARRLRNEGDREAAGEVAKLRKPTAVAWALNQLSRREGGQVEALLRQDERLRELMESGAGGAEFRKATEERREIVRGLARLASAILAGGGHKPTPASSEKIFETLQAVATDAEAREALRRGRLSGDVRPSGFGEGLAVAAPPTGAAGSDDEQRAREAGEVRQRLAEARRTVRERRDEAEDLRRTADRLARAADEAERRARLARKEADRAAADLERADAASKEAARALNELERPTR
jgi:hypothetical protein